MVKSSNLHKPITIVKAVLLTCILIAQPLFAASYKVEGIKGAMAKNVGQRLAVFEKNKYPLTHAILINNLKLAIAPFGYYAPQITIKNRRISIQKGRPTVLTQLNIKIEGPGANILKQHLKHLSLKQGKIFKSEKYEQTKQQLFDLAEQHGYLNARMLKSEVMVEPQTFSARAYIHLKTGDLYKFGVVKFDPSTAYSPLFLKRYVTFKAGSPYNTEKVLALNTALNDSGYFQNLSVKPRIGQDTTVPVDIFLHDKPSQNYLIGLGYVTDSGPRARIGWHWLRVNDFGHTLQALYVGSQRQHTLQAQYVIPGSQPSTDQIVFSSKVFQLFYPVGRSHAQLFSAASVFERNNKQVTLSLNALNESFYYWDTFLDSKITQQVIYPNLKVSYKKISSPLFSKHGFVINGNVKAAREMLASDVDLTQFELSAKLALWLNPTHTRFFFRGNYGLTITDNIYQLPISLQLLAGGANSVRGYHYNGMGPGKHLHVGSAEIQQETPFENWFLTAFYDIGNVYEPNPSHWKRGVGGGLMWVSPVGPIRLSVAKALDDPGQPYRVVFTMGPDL